MWWERSNTDWSTNTNDTLEYEYIRSSTEMVNKTCLQVTNEKICDFGYKRLHDGTVKRSFLNYTDYNNTTASSIRYRHTLSFQIESIDSPVAYTNEAVKCQKSLELYLLSWRLLCDYLVILLQRASSCTDCTVWFHDKCLIPYCCSAWSHETELTEPVINTTGGAASKFLDAFCIDRHSCRTKINDDIHLVQIEIDLSSGLEEYALID